MIPAIKTTAVFLRPFDLPSFNETLPPGEYEIETTLPQPAEGIDPAAWVSSVMVQLHPRTSHPGLTRTLTVPLAELERAVARDKLTGKALLDFFLEEMLADPMIRLVMQADGVAESDLRDFYAARAQGRPGPAGPAQDRDKPHSDDHAEGGGTRGETTRPGIGE
ncbi:hypothetical protein [Maliponia aquimaris]|uniref:Uncharacterized protein n=1 Tax=Maliponia aquimaris TaxID=1673631 RepID=A0A238KPP6_9RHOB|nr:hypothetical protein [Maliponia aquimaris]SMX43996.1 hypothetical protein MAA8898_02960 [Maliponia aquimaris]